MPPPPVLVAAAAFAGLAGLSGLAGVSGLAAATAPGPPAALPSAVAHSRPPAVSAAGRVTTLPAQALPAQALPARAPSAYRWPLAAAPTVLRRFVVGPHPWSPGHRGVDLAAAVGDRVLTAGAGVVSFAGVVAGRGVVAVQHPDGIRTTYEPVTAGVAAGDAVGAGEPLGVLAPGAHCPRSCLHWGALRGDAYLDPLTLLAPPAPAVLLPLGPGGRVS